MSVYRISYPSNALFRTINMTVILPVEAPGQPELFAGKPARFPTLYLLHGFGGNQDDWMDYTRIRDIADRYDLAVVLASGENSFYEDTGVLGAQYGTLFGQELVEYTRRVFPLSDRREDTMIGGMSMGGFGAMRLGCLYCETFGKVFGFSNAFIIDDIAGQQPGYKDLIADYDYYVRTFGDLNRIKNTEKDPLWCLDQAIAKGLAPALYLACGTEDFLLQENRSMKAALDDRDVIYEYHESTGIHDWVFWNQYLEPAVQWALDR